ncbi:MAG: tetratricopeptide repeat protein [Chitinophagales bacterium]
MRLEGGIANTYSYEGNVDLGLPHYYNALKISEKIGNLNSTSNLISNIGTIYYMNENPGEALTYYMRAKDLKLQMKVDGGLDLLYNNIASCYINLNQLKKAFAYLDKALEVSSRTKNKRAISFAYTNYSELHLRGSEYKQALSYAEESIIISKEIENWDSLMRAYLAKAHILEKKGKYSNSVKFTHESLRVAEKFNFKAGVANAYQFLGDLYELMGDFENSCHYLKKYIVIREELNSDKTNKTIAILNAGYESERKDLEIKQLHQQQKMLESKNEELKLFASKASHDMKEPLRMISSFSHILKRQYKVKLDNDALYYLDTIEDASKRMDRLLTDLLNYTLAGINKRAKEKVSLNQICDNIQANLQLVIKEKTAIIEVEELPIIDGYQSDMTQLFQNLISNALKFCTQRTPYIRVEAQELDGEWQIGVHDNGIGILEGDKTRIFELLTRLHSKEEFEGTGIGLATCKKIVEKYKGKIWVESEFGVGTSFFFTLPIKMTTTYDI